MVYWRRFRKAKGVSVAEKQESVSYQDAGVDIYAGEALVEAIKTLPEREQERS